MISLITMSCEYKKEKINIYRITIFLFIVSSFICKIPGVKIYTPDIFNTLELHWTFIQFLAETKQPIFYKIRLNPNYALAEFDNLELIHP